MGGGTRVTARAGTELVALGDVWRGGGGGARTRLSAGVVGGRCVCGGGGGGGGGEGGLLTRLSAGTELALRVVLGKGVEVN